MKNLNLKTKTFHLLSFDVSWCCWWFRIREMKSIKFWPPSNWKCGIPLTWDHLNIKINYTLNGIQTVPFALNTYKYFFFFLRGISFLWSITVTIKSLLRPPSLSFSFFFILKQGQSVPSIWFVSKKDCTILIGSICVCMFLFHFFWETFFPRYNHQFTTQSTDIDTIILWTRLSCKLTATQHHLWKKNTICRTSTRQSVDSAKFNRNQKQKTKSLKHNI